jgi:hypothetical protein
MCGFFGMGGLTSKLQVNSMLNILDFEQKEKKNALLSNSLGKTLRKSRQMIFRFHQEVNNETKEQ